MSSPSPSTDPDQPVLPRLPTELLFEVFRNDWFNYLELAGFARVSRQWLEPARKLLYQGLDLDLGLSSIQNDDPSGSITLPTRTRKMLTTLRDSPHLAQLAKSIYRGTYREPEGEESTSIEVTTVESVVSEIFNLAPNLEGIQRGLGDNQDESYETAFKQHGSKIKYLDVNDIHRRRLELVGECFPNLQELKTESLPASIPPLNPLLLLSDVDLGKEEDTELVTTFLESCASSLRRLSVRLPVAAQLDYSKYPKLEYLHLHSDLGRLPVPPIPRRYSQHELWTRLSEAPSITTLSFDGYRYGGFEEDNLFGVIGLGKQSDESVFTRIKRIEHRRGVVLDRIVALMQHAWLPEGVQIAVPWNPFIEEETRPRVAETNLLQMNALSGMCYSHDAELIYLIDQW